MISNSWETFQTYSSMRNNIASRFMNGVWHQRTVAHRYQFRARDRIAAAEQSDVVTEADQFFCQMVHNSFRPTIFFGRDTHAEMNHLGNFHAEPPEREPLHRYLASQSGRITLWHSHEASLKARKDIRRDPLHVRIETGPS